MQIAEIDVIRYLKQIPFEEVLNYVTRIGTQNGILFQIYNFKLTYLFSDISNGSSNEETSELVMLKLLAFSTTLIRTLKLGLQTFNCIRFKSLTELISHFIRYLID